MRRWPPAAGRHSRRQPLANDDTPPSIDNSLNDIIRARDWQSEHPTADWLQVVGLAGKYYKLLPFHRRGHNTTVRPAADMAHSSHWAPQVKVSARGLVLAARTAR